jgi:predicted membrane-bound spermidine synthase
MGVMILELVAGRLVSKYMGNSLFTWTGVIGVVLGGISLGNFLGGRLADRYPPRRLIILLLLASSMLTFLVLALDALLYRVLHYGSLGPVNGSMVLLSLLLIFILFFLPSACLGTISPVMAKYALEVGRRVGKTVGGIYATAAIGSIIGTFLCGYLLIPLLGLNTIVVLVGSLLAALALLMGPLRVAGTAWLLLIGTGLILAARAGGLQTILYSDSENSRLLYVSDSEYSHIEVRDLRDGVRTERALLEDALFHNLYDPQQPQELLYEYEQLFAALSAEAVGVKGGKDGLSSLTLGAGGCIFPQHLERRFPDGRHVAVEIDSRVLQVARRYFDLRPDSRLKLIVADARNYVQQAQGRERFDLIILDAFNSFAIPYHLTTVEFVDLLVRMLEPRGMILANCIDIFTVGRFLNAYRNTLRQALPYVAVYVDRGFDPQERMTFVLAAAFQPIVLDELLDEEGLMLGRRLPEAQLEELHARCGAGHLSDGYAPVDNLLAPVFLRGGLD